MVSLQETLSIMFYNIHNFILLLSDGSSALFKTFTGALLRHNLTLSHPLSVGVWLVNTLRMRFAQGEISCTRYVNLAYSIVKNICCTEAESNCVQNKRPWWKKQISHSLCADTQPRFLFRSLVLCCILTMRTRNLRRNLMKGFHSRK